MTSALRHILMVEDDPGDVRLTREAVKGSDIAAELHVVVDGEAAIAFLRKHTPYIQAPRPDLVLLDLNLPRKNGHEVLDEIKSDPALQTIPVVVLTTSSNQRDVAETYHRMGNCYVTKPADFETFAATILAIERFWLQTVILPPGGSIR